MWLDHILDEERAREKMNVHHGGDPRLRWSHIVGQVDGSVKVYSAA